MLSRGQIDPEHSMRIQSMCIGACTVSINGTQMVWGGGVIVIEMGIICKIKNGRWKF